MKRIVYAILATVTGLVLLFSYRTSLDAVAPVAALSGTGATNTSGTTGSDSSSDSGSTSDPRSTASDSTASGSSDPTPTPGSSDSADDTGTGSGTGTTSTVLTDGTFTGASANTRYGPVQVQITVSGGVISAATAVDYPNSNGRDAQINQYAIPQLVSETLSAQSAQIDMVSGATFTSLGYAQSLQSAIDQAKS